MDLAQIRHVAELAELSLTEQEESRLAADLGRILAYVAELDALDTSGVEPTAQLASGGEDAWRVDEARTGLSHEDALAGAPRPEHEGFGVPTFVE
jgi:aspartyl-tRNA(Asn)/glutamyl-tRNA(Gln) amidotransferase subunit C